MASEHSASELQTTGKFLAHDGEAGMIDFALGDAATVASQAVTPCKESESWMMDFSLRDAATVASQAVTPCKESESSSHAASHHVSLLCPPQVAESPDMPVELKSMRLADNLDVVIPAAAPQQINTPENVVMAPHASENTSSKPIPTLEEVEDSHRDSPFRAVIKWDEARRNRVNVRVPRKLLMSKTVSELRDPAFIRPLVIEVNALPEFNKERAVTVGQLLNFLLAQKKIADEAASFEESWVQHVKAYAALSRNGENNVYQRMHAANVRAGKISN
jgi:hypothetical protein